MRSLSMVGVLVLALLSMFPTRASADEIQRLTLTDGSQVFGHVESEEADGVRFRSVSGIVLSVPRAQIADIRVVEGHVLAGEFLPADSHNTRLLFAPTGRALKKGQGYFGVYELIFPFVQVGITNRLSVGGGTPLIFGGGGTQTFWFTPKLQLLATSVCRSLQASFTSMWKTTGQESLME